MASLSLHEEKDQAVVGYAAHDATGQLSLFHFTRRPTGKEDITFKVQYCGICHSDLHNIKNEWRNSRYPMVPGHEIVGIVKEVGEDVKGFKAGDRVGVGCLVGSCNDCEACESQAEQFCDKKIWTYNSVYHDGKVTQGGYSSLMVVNYRYALQIPENLPLDAAAPLLCAGITVYSPMKFYGMTQKGKHFGVVGLGGLGHIAVKFGKAFGMKVTVISTSPSKEKEAKEALGADNFLSSKDMEQMKGALKSFDYIIDTVSAPHSLEPLLALLKVNGKFVLVGLPQKPFQLLPQSLIFGRRMVAGSLIGSIQETQEMLNFCGEHNVICTIEKINMDYVNTAMERLEHSDVKYRFVIVVANTLGGE